MTTSPDTPGGNPDQHTEAAALSDDELVRAALMTSAWTTYEVLLGPDDIAWTRAKGHPLKIIRRPDGRVLITAAHAPTCALITSNDRSPCDLDCVE